MSAREIIEKSIKSLFRDKEISGEELYNYINSDKGIIFGETDINPEARPTALGLVRRFFSNRNRKEKLIEEIMSKKFTSNENVMSRKQAAEEADKIMRNKQYDINAFMKLDYNGASRMLQQLIKETDIELANKRAIADAKIKDIERRKNANELQKELKKIIDDKTASPLARQQASDEYEDLEEERFRFIEGGKRKIYTKYLEHLAKSGFLNLAVLDEIHTVKNGDPNSKDESVDLDHQENFTTFNIQEITNNVPNVWGASATVVANKPIDLYNQLQAVNNPLGDVKYEEFERVASAGIPGMPGNAGTARAIRDALVQQGVYLQRSKDQIWDKKKTDDIQNALQEKFKIKISQEKADSILKLLRGEGLSADVLKGSLKDIIGRISDKRLDSVVEFLQNFNPHNVKQIISEESAKDNIIYEGYDSLIEYFNNDFRRRVEETMSKGVQGKNLRLAMFTHYRFAAAKAKVPNTLSLVGTHIAKGERVGVFTASDEALDELSYGIQKMLDNSPKFRGKRVLEVRGGQNVEERSREVNKFKESENKSPYGAVVINVKAGGTGISLENTAYWSVFNDLPISVSEDEQALGRFFRINTDDDVSVSYMIATSIQAEQKFYASLQRKKELAKDISKLEDEDRKFISQGLFASDEQRRGLLIAIAQRYKEMEELNKETEMLANNIVDDAIANSGKPRRPRASRPRKKASQYANWYKFASSIIFTYK